MTNSILKGRCLLQIDEIVNTAAPLKTRCANRLFELILVLDMKKPEKTGC